MRASRQFSAALAVALLAATLLPTGRAGAQSANPPNISPIVAEFSFPVTTYDVLAVDPDGDTLTYRWTKTKERDCGDLTGANTDTFKWSHPHPPCPNEEFHPGTITVVVSDGTFRCSATYPYGSAAGTGPEPEPCTAISDPASVFCPGFARSDGWFEPTQGVWQDDSFWRDKPTKQLRKVSTGNYEAELQMVRNRPTVITGIDHAHNEPKGSHRRSEIIMEVVTTGSKKVPVKFRITLTETGGSREIYSSPVLGRIPLLKPCGERKRLRLKVTAAGGVPTASTFTFNNAGAYALKNELLRADTNEPIGLEVNVSGETVETSFPTTSFLATTLSATNAAGNNSLLTNAVRLAGETRSRFPDYMPLPTGGINTFPLPIVFSGETTLETGRQNWLNWANATSASTTPADLRTFKSQALAAATGSMLNAFAHLGRAGRMIVLLSTADIERINPWPFAIAGLAVSEKVVVVAENEAHDTVAHELVHSIPYVWLDDQQTPCGPNYHNKTLNTAYGLQLTSAGQPSRRRFNGVRSYMEIYEASWWTDQCTYWHLLGELQEPIDPPVLLVRGRFAQSEGGTIGELLPAYEMAEGVADLGTDSKGRYAIVLRDATGAELARYKFTPSFKYASHPGRPRKLVPFDVRIPDMDGIATIELVGPNGVLDTMTSSSATPSVSITSPRNNSTVNATNSTVNVTWTGSDSDSDPLLYTVMYSNDGGTSWIPQVFETSATTATIEVSGTDHMVKVVATDGAHSSEATAAFKTR